MSRTKRFLNRYQEKLNEDGTVKIEYRQKQLAKGLSEAACDDFALRMKKEYDHLKLLDETKPEAWPVYTAYDFFSEEEKKQFQPDGALRTEYIEHAHYAGISKQALAEMERKKKIEVNNFNRLSEHYAVRGINFGESEMRSRISAVTTYRERLNNMPQDIRNGEAIDTLPLDIDVDDYYQQQGYNVNQHNF